MALLTEIHYFFIHSPLDIEGECSQSSVLATVKSYWCGLVSYSWKVVTVSSLTPDDSVDLRPRWCGGYLTLFVTRFSFTPTLAFYLSLPLSLSQCLSHTPCLCAGCCCLIARSPSRSSDVVVVVCQRWLESVTCICPGSFEGVCFCSQSCKQGGASVPKHPVGDGYFHRSFFLFIILVNRLAWDEMMCWSR